MVNIEKKLKTNTRKELCGAIVIATVLFTNLAIENEKYMKYILLILAITLLYAMFLILKNPQNIKKMVSSYSFFWITFFSIEMFIYGYLGENTAEYSLKYHVLNIIWIMIILIVLNNNSNRVIETMSKASSITIVLITLFIIFSNSLDFTSIFSGKVIGFTAVGNQNTTAMSYIFLLIPIIYNIGVNRTKKYIPVGIIGIIFMLLTGSKKSIISLILMIAIIGLGKSTNYIKLLKNIFKVIFFISIIVVICYYIPALNKLIWQRLEAMINSLNEYDSASQSSTSLRMTFIITAFTKGWNKPILGHGWGSFAPLYGYSPLYKAYLYTHNNYAEIFFSFGLFGLFLYYWFPIMNIIRTKKSYDVSKKIICWLYIIILLFLDFGAVNCYSSILPYLGFATVSLILKS